MKEQLTLDNIGQQKNLYYLIVSKMPKGRWEFCYRKCNVKRIIPVRDIPSFYHISIEAMPFSFSIVKAPATFEMVVNGTEMKDNDMPYFCVNGEYYKGTHHERYLCTSFKAALMLFNHKYIKNIQERYKKKRERIYKTLYTRFMTVKDPNAFYVVITR